MKNLKSGLGIWQILNSNIITDIIAKSGFSLTIFDLEHGLHSPQTIQDCTFTAKSNSLYTIVRIPCDSYQNIVQIIDTGVDAILFPHIESVEQLKGVIERSSLFPKGSKSFSPFVTRYNYGEIKEDFTNPSIGILIESLIGLKNSENLINNKEVDFIYFGAYDLSLEINQPGKIFSSEIISYLKEVIKYSKKYNKKTLSIYRNKEELEYLIKLGVDFPISSVDTSHLMNKLKQEEENYRSTKN